MSDEPTDRPVQYFSDDYLAHCAEMSAEQVCEFLEDYRQIVLGSGRVPRTTISVRVQDPLLRAFRRKAEALGVPYQTQIQRLMAAWVRDG